MGDTERQTQTGRERQTDPNRRRHTGSESQISNRPRCASRQQETSLCVPISRARLERPRKLWEDKETYADRQRATDRARQTETHKQRVTDEC